MKKIMEKTVSVRVVIVIVALIFGLEFLFLGIVAANYNSSKEEIKEQVEQLVAENIEELISENVENLVIENVENLVIDNVEQQTTQNP